MEDGSVGALPTKQDEEFRPFIRRLPEFKFWYSATRAISIGFLCTWFSIFDVPVFWPVLVVYWLILFALTSMYFPDGIEEEWERWINTNSLGIVRRQIQHMIKYRYVPFSIGKAKYNKNSSWAFNFEEEGFQREVLGLPSGPKCQYIDVKSSLYKSVPVLSWNCMAREKERETDPIAL